jgi:hypothetical protein
LKEKMPAIPGVNMSAIGPVVGALWESAKSKIPSKCKEMAGGGVSHGGGGGAPNENTNFAKFGGGGPQKSAGSHEMSDMGRRRAASTASSDDFCGGESGHKGPDFKINEWQAAWNVTNAIQVFAFYVIDIFNWEIHSLTCILMFRCHANI